MSLNQEQAPASQIVLVHISDLHIGDSLMPDPADFKGGAFTSGYNPHDYRLLLPLAVAIRDGRRRLKAGDRDPLHLVMSGDLTQSGLENDYATALALLHEQWEWKRHPSRSMGFGWKRDHTIMVPGNHDHWRHKTFQTAFNPGLAPAWFTPTPWRRVIESPDSSLRLEIFGVDSNSGFDDEHKKLGQRNPFASGKIKTDELVRLELLLEETAGERDPAQVCVRILVCHHAFSKVGYFGAHPLEKDCRTALLGIAARHGISVVLTGHTHEFHEQDWPAGDHDRKWVKELRCATSLQGTRSSPGLQGFWLHSLRRPPTSRHCEWSAWKYQAGAKFFQVTPRPVTFFPAAV
jgi:3',5'-cyclic AMP phosphodiesterase CpdA